MRWWWWRCMDRCMEKEQGSYSSRAHLLEAPPPFGFTLGSWSLGLGSCSWRTGTTNTGLSSMTVMSSSKRGTPLFSGVLRLTVTLLSPMEHASPEGHDMLGLAEPLFPPPPPPLWPPLPPSSASGAFGRRLKWSRGSEVPLRGFLSTLRGGRFGRPHLRRGRPCPGKVLARMVQRDRNWLKNRPIVHAGRQGIRAKEQKLVSTFRTLWTEDPPPEETPEEFTRWSRNREKSCGVLRIVKSRSLLRQIQNIFW